MFAVIFGGVAEYDGAVPETLHSSMQQNSKLGAHITFNVAGMKDSFASWLSASPLDRRAEWKRLGMFLGFGTAAFLVAVVVTAFVPLGWPDAIRRSAHPTIFVPLAVALTSRLLARDASTVGSAELFNPWPVGRASAAWLLLGTALAGIVALTFAILFGLRWGQNPQGSAGSTALALWAIVLTAAAEEVAFRGYALWRLTRLLGFWQAQAVVAVLFAVSHLTLGGYALLPALVGTVAGSALYGVAFARTRGIAAPIALHSGWNIAQHLFLSPLNPSATPLIPTFPHAPTQTEYIAMLAVLTIVMGTTTVAIVLYEQAHQPVETAG